MNDKRTHVGQVTVPSRVAVLIVEDDPLLLMNAMDMLEDAGFVVIGACNADEAVRVMEARDDIQGLFTDVDMPGSMDGLELARSVSRRWPLVAVIVASGRSRPSKAELPQGGRFIPKPYAAEAVTSAMAEMTGVED